MTPVRDVARILICLGALAAPRLAAQIQRAPTQTRTPSKPHAESTNARYERTDAATGVVWTLVLDQDGTVEVRANGRLATDSSGRVVYYQYRIAGTQLYLTDARTQHEELFGLFNGSTLTTVLGVRYEKR